MQCKDIPTRPILEFVRIHGGVGCSWYSGGKRDVSNAMPPGLSDNLRHAKMRQLINKGLIDGCGCGCRGDFEITEKGLEELRDGEVNDVEDIGFGE